MTDMDIARDGVEAVARFYEKTFHRGTPFHLAPCGGCGAPSFSQPCAICNYYPMGRDKGIYSPHDATIDQFTASVDRSGPYGQRGNLATWYLASYRRTVAHQNTSFASKITEAIKEAANLDLPSPELFWSVASRPAEGGLVCRHERNRRDLAIIWSVSDELANRSADLAGRGAIRPDRMEKVLRAVSDWVEAAHDGDDRAVFDAAKELESQIGEVLAVTRDGNLYYSRKRLQEEIEILEARQTHSPKI